MDLVQSRARINIARHHATPFFEAGINKYSQWFPGRESNVANALLFDFDCSDNELTKILCKSCPSQLPHHFQIAPMANKISSWLTSLLQRLPVKEQIQEAHTRAMIGCGTDLSGNLEPSTSATMPSSTPSQYSNQTRSLVPLPWLSRRDGFFQQLMTPWHWEQSKIPCWMYL